jgi:thymidylate kinase
MILARKPLLLPRRAGLSLALLGPNGVGKSTAAAHLQRSFPFESRLLYMGVWKHAGTTDPHAVRIAELTIRPLRIWSRYLIALYHQLRGRLVIFDRYVYEARLPAKPPLLIAKRLYFWLLAHSVPPPRAVLVLDVPGAVAYRRKQENRPLELDAERRIYLELAARLPRAELIDARPSTDGVCAEITAIVWRELSSRWRGGSARR